MSNNNTNTRQKPWQGQAKADGGDFKTDIPSEDTHQARVVALIDLGTHHETFQNGDAKDMRKCLICFELDEEMTGMKGTNHVVAKQYTMSFHEKANLRQLAEALLNEGQKFAADSGVDYERLLGRPCMIQIAHTKKVSEKGERTYTNIKSITAVPKKLREGVFAPKRKVTVWSLGDDLEALPSWLPRLYGEEIKDVIGRCRELKGAAPAARGEGEVAGPGEGAPDYDTSGGADDYPF
jgi:hypothetical protein